MRDAIRTAISLSLSLSPYMGAVGVVVVNTQAQLLIHATTGSGIQQQWSPHRIQVVLNLFRHGDECMQSLDSSTLGNQCHLLDYQERIYTIDQTNGQQPIPSLTSERIMMMLMIGIPDLPKSPSLLLSLVPLKLTEYAGLICSVTGSARTTLNLPASFLENILFLIIGQWHGILPYLSVSTSTKL
jgi:hypothetical protein